MLRASIARACLVGSVLAACVLTSPASAAAGAQVVDRQAHQITGAEIALGMLADVHSVDVDRSGVTVQLQEAGEMRPVRVELGGLLEAGSAGAGGDTAGILRFGTLLFVIGALIRTARTLTRLGQEEC